MWEGGNEGTGEGAEEEGKCGVGSGKSIQRAE